MSTVPTPLFRNDEEDAAKPVSERIRSRLVRANQRYHANDNISAISKTVISKLCAMKWKSRWRKC